MQRGHYEYDASHIGGDQEQDDRLRQTEGDDASERGEGENAVVHARRA